MRRLALLVVVLVFAAVARAGAPISVDEALATAWPGAHFERETIFLTETQLDRVEQTIGKRPESALVTRFRARSGSSAVGWAYLDTHRVRTLPETVMVIVNPDGTVRSVEVVAFREPLDYLPPESWYAQYEDRRLDEDLELKRGIRPITGATLTARATTDAVRRVLAVHGSISQDGTDP